MGRPPDDRFRIFISHKHEDHALALATHQALESLTPTVECFVSGVDIVAGSDWNREIRTQLAQSHLLVLLFTQPTQTWDWCLYETGLFTRFEADEVTAVVSIFSADSGAPRVLANLQGVEARHEAVNRFLTALCKETWRVSDDWRLGALAPRVKPAQIERAAAKIVNAFPHGSRDDSPYYPCHRVVLDLRAIDEIGDHIPEEARVIEGPNDTTGFTLSLFNMADGRRHLTWRDLLVAVDGLEAGWRAQLDRRFVCALNEQLFTPITATLRAWNQGRRHQRLLKPVLYRILRAPVPAGSPPDARGRPTGVTVVFDPQLAPTQVGGPALNLVRINARFGVEVFDEFVGTVRHRVADGLDVFVDIGEAIRLVYEEADRFGVFDENSLRRAYGPDYESKGIEAMGREWIDSLERLKKGLEERDADLVEEQLAALRQLNRSFSTASTERYLDLLRAGAS
ncbi:MAG TPA: toll/interleukin-1 receptor domain-containing protein [Nocardioidaceae bacterium]